MAAGTVGDRTGYPTADLSDASICIFLAGPLTGGFVAKQLRGFSRFTRSMRSARSGLTVTLVAWWPLLLGTPLVVSSAVLVTARRLPNDGASWSLVLVDFMALLACALLGFGLAWAFPSALAVPTATAACFLWLSYTPGTDKALLHNMHSTFAACCSSHAEPATGAVLASLTFTTLICLGVGLLLVPGEWARRPRAVVAGLVLGLVGTSFAAGAAVAVTSVDNLTLQAIEPRSTPLTCQVDSGVRLCLWPENEDRAGEIRAAAQDLNTSLSTWDLPTIEAITQGTTDRGAVSVEAGDNLSAHDLRYSVASGYVDLRAGCIGAFGRARDERTALLAVAAGLPEANLAGMFYPDPGPVVREQLDKARTSPEDVGPWFDEGLADTHCGPDS